MIVSYVLTVERPFGAEGSNDYFFQLRDVPAAPGLSELKDGNVCI